MLIDTINNSISNRNRHLSEIQLNDFFENPDAEDPLHRYVADVIFQEATLQETVRFLADRQISLKKIKALFNEYKRLNPVKEKYEWFFG